ncbi:MAG: hypothetical protein L3K02_00330, partial [Thermoplasmata archaeon]|nr:hypothetical protein [Thermoplasmata archaeon]
MRGGTLGLVILAVLVLILSGTTIGLTDAGHVGLPSPNPPALITDERNLSPHTTVRPLDPSTPISLALTLPYANAAKLAQLLVAVESPTSPEYRHFLTHDQFVADFAPPAASLRAVTDTLRSVGAEHVSVSGSGAVVTAVISAGSIQQLFGVRLVEYFSDRGIPLYTALGVPSLPSGLSGQIVGIGGLSDGANPYLSLGLHPSELRPVHGAAAPQFVLSNTSSEWFVGSDYTQAYGAAQLFPNGTAGANATFPTRVAVATLLASGYNESTTQNLPPWDPTVVEQYFNDSFPRSWPQSVPAGVPVNIDGISAPPPGSFGTLNDSSLDEFENSLDLEMAGSIAPGAALYNFYFAGSLLAGNTPVGDLANDFADDFGAALAFNYTPARLGVVSGSFGLPDLNDSEWNSYLTEAAAMGVTVVMASGDQGNAPDSQTGRNDGQWPVWPASAAFNSSGSISVGGVSLTLAGVPTTTWNGTSLNVSFDDMVNLTEGFG